MRKGNWLDVLFLTAVLVISAVSAGLVSFPKAPTTAPEPVARTTRAEHIPAPRLGETAQTLTYFLAPLNAPSSLVVSQVGDYLSRPQPVPDPSTSRPTSIED